LSDLNGTDVYAHGGTPAGVFRELLSASCGTTTTTVRQMTVIFEVLRKNLRPILQETGAASPFEASVQAVSVYASALADELGSGDSQSGGGSDSMLTEEELRRLYDESRQL